MYLNIFAEIVEEKKHSALMKKKHSTPTCTFHPSHHQISTGRHLIIPLLHSTCPNPLNIPLQPCSEHPKDRTNKTSLLYLSFRELYSLQVMQILSLHCPCLQSTHYGHRPLKSIPSCDMMHHGLSGWVP